MDRRQITTNNAPVATGPYSQAVEINNCICTSGQLPVCPVTNTIVKGDIESQTIQVIKNTEAILLHAGYKLCDVVKANVFLKDLSLFIEFNKTYGQFFEFPYPARSCVEVSRLPKDVLIEMDVIAVK